jgi:feruloyl esterase
MRSFIDRAALAMVLSTLMPWAPGLMAAEPAYSIRSLHSPIPDFIASGDGVEIQVTGPSTAALLRASLWLNGRDVSSALHPDGTAGSLTGVIPGLKPGANTLTLYRTKRPHGGASQLSVFRAIAPAVNCDGLGAVVHPDTVVTSTTLNADGTTSAAGVLLPEHCVLRGTIEPRTGEPNNRSYGTMFELRLPSQWNGRFFFQGQGGTGGSVVAATGQSQLPPGNRPPLADGWAVVSFDGGHQGGDVLFGLDEKAKVDFAYHSMDIAAIAAKAFIAQYYGQGPNYSYFAGCSNGGRQGMMFSQRFPTYFDGIIAGSATYRLSVTYVDSSWGLQQVTAIAPKNADGAPLMAQAFLPEDMTLVANDILAVCDARDGVVDKMVLNTDACNFRDYNPARLECTGEKTPSCLTKGQVTALRNLHRGARDSAGRQLYNTWPWDPGVGGAQWRSWKLGTSTTSVPNAIKYSFCSTSVGYLYLTPPVPGFDCLKMDFDSDPARLAENAWLDAANPDLKAFRKHGGKILWYHGTADPSTPYTDIIRYYRDMSDVTIRRGKDGDRDWGHRHREHAHDRVGDMKKAADFARVFVVPGFGHCNGGSGLDRFDPLTPMVNWVEKGMPPEKMLATGDNFPGRSRPLCAYPKTAKYDGSGDLEDAENFSCQGKW